MQEIHKPQVSIIVPVYNVEAYLTRCLNSIQAQTLKEWECICIDDGSPDGCGAILDEWAARDSRFVVIHQENAGVSVARNAGIDAARAEYIGFVDPDDWIEPETYQIALETARSTGADIVQWGQVVLHGDRVFYKERREGFFDARDYGEYITCGVKYKLFRSAFVIKNNIRFPAGVRRGQDAPFSIMAYAFAKSSFYLNRALYHYDFTRESSVSNNITEKMLLETEAAFRKTFAFLEKERRDWCNRGGAKAIFLYKMQLKNDCKTIDCCKGSSRPRRNYRLCRTIFPEINKQVPLYFLKTRTKSAFVLLLAVWHMGWLAEAIFWVKAKLRAHK